MKKIVIAILAALSTACYEPPTQIPTPNEIRVIYFYEYGNCFNSLCGYGYRPYGYIVPRTYIVPRPSYPRLEVPRHPLPFHPVK